MLSASRCVKNDIEKHSFDLHHDLLSGPDIFSTRCQFAVCNNCIVADRYMIKKETIEEIRNCHCKYILWVRMR
jgi:hypothetical protein